MIWASFVTILDLGMRIIVESKRFERRKNFKDQRTKGAYVEESGVRGQGSGGYFHGPFMELCHCIKHWWASVLQVVAASHILTQSVRNLTEHIDNPTSSHRCVPSKIVSYMPLAYVYHEKFMARPQMPPQLPSLCT